VVPLPPKIWKIAEERGWIAEDQSFVALAEDFAVWSQGLEITTADQDALTEYRNYLKPPTKMRRPRGDS
jgi:hypothetical protein